MSRSALGYGAAMIVGGMAIIGVIDNFVRVIAEDAGLWQFHLTRSAMALPLLLLVAALAGLRLRPRRWRAVVARCGVQACSMLLYFGSLPMMPIAEVGAALFTAPLWVLVFARLLFRRQINAISLVAVGIGFAGMLLLLRPDPANLEPLVLMPLAAGALYGLSNLLTREWCADEPVGALLATFFAAMGAASLAALAILALAPPPAGWLEAAPFLTQGWTEPTGRFLLWTLVQAVGTLISVSMLVRGYQSGETSVLAVFEYFFLVSASVSAWLLWGEGLDAVGIAGIALIVASGALIAGSAHPHLQAAAAGWKRR